MQRIGYDRLRGRVWLWAGPPMQLRGYKCHRYICIQKLNYRRECWMVPFHKATRDHKCLSGVITNYVIDIIWVMIPMITLAVSCLQPPADLHLSSCEARRSWKKQCFSFFNFTGMGKRGTVVFWPPQWWELWYQGENLIFFSRNTIAVPLLLATAYLNSDFSFLPCRRESSAPQQTFYPSSVAKPAWAH